MKQDSVSSEKYSKSLKAELKRCLKPYNQEKHLEYLLKVIDFQTWCNHLKDNGETAIERGEDKDTGEKWSQCQFCRKNID